jgi:hypothetical protein
MATTMKVKCRLREPAGDGQVRLEFGPDYDDDRNKDWAKYTPALSFSATVKEEVADREFPSNGDTFTVTFEREENRG